MFTHLRSICAAIFGLAAFFPSDGIAQFRDPFPYARVTISPLIGYRLPYDARVEGTVYTQTTATSAEFTEERGGGTLVGGEAEVQLIGRLSTFASLLYASPVANVVTERGRRPEQFTGPNIWFGSVGFVLRLPEPIPDYRRFPFVTSIHAAPAIVREIPRGSRLPPEHDLYVENPWETIDHFAVNAGFQATILLGTPSIALQLGVSDYITFWNSRAVERQLERAYREQLGEEIIAEYRMPVSHQFVGQAGLSLRF
jgi:hypothetical protein